MKLQKDEEKSENEEEKNRMKSSLMNDLYA